MDYCYSFGTSITQTRNHCIYLNQVDFVNGAVGIRSAAKIYMNKGQKDLTIEESALFVGMLKIHPLQSKS